MAKRCRKSRPLKAQFAPDAVGVENQARNAADTLYGNGRPVNSQEIPFELGSGKPRRKPRRKPRPKG